jgi:ankyrin repeat protein
MDAISDAELHTLDDVIATAESQLRIGLSPPPIRTLPGELCERIARRVLKYAEYTKNYYPPIRRAADDDKRTGFVLHSGPSLARAILGPGALAEDGDAYRLVAEFFGVSRSDKWPTWRGVVDELRNEWKKLPVVDGVKGAKRLIPAIMQGSLLLVQSGLSGAFFWGRGMAKVLCRDPTRPSSPHKLPLFYACEGWSLDIVELLIARRADVNARDKQKMTPLMSACLNPLGTSYGIVDALIAAGADVNARDRQGRTPLIFACDVNDVRAAKVQSLLAAGADVHARSDEGHTAMKYAFMSSELGVGAIGLLLNASADANSCLFGTTSVLEIASEHGNVAVVQALLAAGANVNANFHGRYSDQSTALVAASLRGHVAVVEVLLAAGAKVNPRRGAASRRSFFSIVPALHVAITSPDHAKTCPHRALAVVRTLLAARADVNDNKNRWGEPALVLATQLGNLRMMRALLDAGADANARTFDGKTVLEWAVQLGRGPVVEVLRASGATE